jgi:hypothetical protein
LTRPADSAIGLSGNSEKEHDERIASIAQEVSATMRRRYATDPWTKKAAPYVWPVKKDGENAD